MPNSRQQQHGAVAIMMGFTLLVLIGMLALVADLGHLYLAKTGLQNAADAAALSGARQLDGSVAGICCDTSGSAVGRAINTAGRNTFFGSTGNQAVVLTEADIHFGTTPDGPWENVATAQASPANYLFIQVDTGNRNLATWFAPIWNLTEIGTFATAVAGPYGPRAGLSPIFVPAVRRNSNYKDSNAAYPNCKGYVYDSKIYKNKCPSLTNGDTDPTNYRTYDYSGNWGFLRAGQCRLYTDLATVEVPCPAGPLPVGTEKGSYYVIAPRSNNKWDTGTAATWQVGTSWTGNFGFMLKSSDEKTQKELLAALCQGGSSSSYPLPGCGSVHPGSMSGPKITANLNTRFDEALGNNSTLPQSMCPSDTNIYGNNFTGSSWQPQGYYTGYAAGSPLLAPTEFPPGKAGRRIIRMFVIDNAWTSGYNVPSTPNDDGCLSTLTGGSLDAHLVGCAEFFMWMPSDNQGDLYTEFVQALPASQCYVPSGGSVAQIRLYH